MSFEDIIEISNEKTTHQQNLEFLAKEIYEFTYDLSPPSIFYKQPVYKQLALGWQIAKKLSGLNSLLLITTTKKRKVEFFLCSLYNKCKKAVKPTINQKTLLGISDPKY